LRDELNPHELLKTVKNKAETECVDKIVIENNKIQAYLHAFRSDVEKNIISIRKTLIDIVPAVNEIQNSTKEVIAARQSNCLVCGKRTPSPELERRNHHNISMHDDLVSDFESGHIRIGTSQGRNRGFHKNKTLTEDAFATQGTGSKANLPNVKHQAIQSITSEDELSQKTVILRKNSKGSRCATALDYMGSQKRKYNLPLSYQVMNDRHKEGSLGSLQSTYSGFK